MSRRSKRLPIGYTRGDLEAILLATSGIACLRSKKVALACMARIRARFPKLPCPTVPQARVITAIVRYAVRKPRLVLPSSRRTRSSRPSSRRSTRKTPKPLVAQWRRRRRIVVLRPRIRRRLRPLRRRRPRVILVAQQRRRRRSVVKK